MLLSKIVSGLHNYSRKWVSSFNREYDMQSLSLLNGADNFEHHILYFGYASELPRTLSNDRLTFLCIADCQLPDHFEGPTANLPNLILLDASCDYDAILKLLLGLFGSAAKVSSGRSRLIEVLHKNEGIQVLVDTASDILKNPIIVVDTSYKILAMSSTGFGSDRSDLEEQRTLGFMLKTNIDAMQRAKLYEQARQKGYPIYNKSPDQGHGWITALIYIHGIEVGQIGVMDELHAFSESDYEIIDFLCKVISLELQKSDFYRTNQGLMHSYFLSDLLDNQLQDQKTIDERVEALGWNLGSSLRIMVLSDANRNFFEGKAQLITRQLQHLLPDSRWVIYHGQIVFLLTTSSPVSAEYEDGLADYLKINQLNASISNPFSNLLDVNRHYRQAQIADRYGSRLQPEEVVHLYSNYVFYHMADLVNDGDELVNFYHPGLVALRDYDKSHHTEFLKTLKLYLIFIDQPEEIAKRLFVHKNTIFYRIAKIRDQFHLNLSDGEERFRIHMTIKLMELEN